MCKNSASQRIATTSEYIFKCAVRCGGVVGYFARRALYIYARVVLCGGGGVGEFNKNLVVVVVVAAVYFRAINISMRKQLLRAQLKITRPNNAWSAQFCALQSIRRILANFHAQVARHRIYFRFCSKARVRLAIFNILHIKARTRTHILFPKTMRSRKSDGLLDECAVSAVSLKSSKRKYATFFCKNRKKVKSVRRGSMLKIYICMH